MATFKLTIEYDGTPFRGFQMQKNPEIHTIQGELQKTISSIFDIPIKIYVAGRTDTGVHALNQVIHFKTEKEFSPAQLHRALNGRLHKAISVKKVELAPETFHARHSSLARKYIYLVDNSRHPSALYKDRSYWYPRKLDLELMRRCCALLEGNHDFRLFAKNTAKVENTVRTLDVAQIYSEKDFQISAPDELKTLFQPRPDMLMFFFKSKSFLHSQVRIMVGNIIEVGVGNIPIGDLESMLIPDSCLSPKAVKIPGGGLYIAGIDYPP
jgi:tRNA pseudouridine38-40 synthase